MPDKVKLRSLREEVVEDKGLEGLRDDGHVYPTCSNCDAVLMDVWLTRPHEPEVWKIKCNCPFCGDSSFEQEIKGGFHMGGAPSTHTADEEAPPSTLVESFETDNKTFKFKITKARPDVQPLYRR